jgi:hypothetical protein
MTQNLPREILEVLTEIMPEATVDDAMASLMRPLSQHCSGDWGTVDAEDWEANNAAIADGTRILSAYMVHGVKVWIITEADRSVTTLLLPRDY